MPNDSCFLCNPDHDLVYHRSGSFFAMAGLGPVTAGYSVLGTSGHVPSMADLRPQELAELMAFLLGTRRALSGIYDRCLVTEHGRVPVCTRSCLDSGVCDRSSQTPDLSRSADAHCFHAHFLVFPAALDVLADAAANFTNVHRFTSLLDAFDHLPPDTEYFLLSPSDHVFYIMIGWRQFTRQFARFIVANALRRPETADWRAYPARAEAVLTASVARQTFAKV